jgi:hypothetical protein
MKAANLGITLGQSFVYVGQINILLLRINNLPSQGWSEGHNDGRHILRYLDA